MTGEISSVYSIESLGNKFWERFVVRIYIDWCRKEKEVYANT